MIVAVARRIILRSFTGFIAERQVNGIIAAAALVSLYYHHTDEVGLKRTDKVLAYSVILSNLYILYLSDFKQPYFSVAIIFVIIAFYFLLTGKEHKYDVYHGVWHLCSVVITLMCVLAY